MLLGSMGEPSVSSVQTVEALQNNVAAGSEGKVKLGQDSVATTPDKASLVTL
jgi:hypothetical protein